jgi:hypothetical protein
MPPAMKSALLYWNENDEARMTNAELMTNDKRRMGGANQRPASVIRPFPNSFVIGHSDFVIKKIPPPTSDGCEGRLFPPEHS